MTQKQCAKGSLLASLGWMGKVLGPLIQEHPAIASSLLLTSRVHLHAMALALSVTDRVTPELVAAALDSPVKELLRQLPLPEPRGMRRLLGRLPHAILPREDYQRAAALLADASAANVLRHAPSVTSALLMNLDQLPPRMRTPVVLRAIGDHADAGKYLLQWIDVVTARLPGTPPSTLPDLISRSRSLVQLQSGLRHFIDELPALSESPPEKISHATRLGTTNEIRRVGRRFQNCLSSFNGRRYGSRWLYHWQSGAEEAICEVVRAENMGWFLGDHLGFGNKDLLPEVSARICAAFQQVGIVPRAAVDAFEALYYYDGSRS